MITGLIIAITLTLAAAMLVGDHRDLRSWTRTGGRAARGRETEPLADGSPDWSRPRCAPDNGPRAVAGRLAPIVLPLAGAVPVIWFGLHGVRWVSTTIAARTAAWEQPDWQIYAQSAAGGALVVAVAGTWLAWRAGVLAALRAHLATRHTTTADRPAPAPSPLPVSNPASRTPLAHAHHGRIEWGGEIPAGQLVYRRYDSTVLAQSTPGATPERKSA